LIHFVTSAGHTDPEISDKIGITLTNSFPFSINSMLLLISGLPGSGKSFFAKAFSAKLGASHINSDQVRKALKKRGMYSDEAKMEVYLEMEQIADRELSLGRRVVVDATFYLKESRDRFRLLAQKHGTDLYMIVVMAKEKLVRERLARPRPDSEADFEVYKKIKSQFEPFEEPHLELESTNENLDEMFHHAEAYIF
jgi:predicted kinase